MRRRSASLRWFAARPGERAVLEQLRRHLRSIRPGDAVALASPTGRPLRLPDSAVLLLREAVSLLATAHEVAVLPLDREVTSTQAAEILGVSRPVAVRLLDEGAIPSHRVGRHRRADLRDVLAYKARRRRRGE